MFSILVFWNVTRVVFAVMAIFTLAMILRLTFAFTDPNPFGKVGRFAYWLRKKTDRFVQPFADFLFLWRIDKKYAPILAALVYAVLAYFGLRIFGNFCFIADGVIASISTGNLKALVGYTLFAAVSLYILFIFLRILSSWFVFTRRTFFGFVRRVTDPVMIPVQRLIPPIGMIDISAMIVLVVLQVLQSFILQAFVY